MNEILKMAFGSLGVNKLRSFLTMSGITIGVFSVIGVMTAVSALRGSIETGLSFLGSNMFQFSRFPPFGVNGNDEHKYLARRRVSLDQAQRYIDFMHGTSDVVCLKCFTNGNPVVQASYGGRKTTKGVQLGGSNQYFLKSNQFDIATGRNLTPEDVELVRPVAIIGPDIIKKVFRSENPLGKQVKANEHTYTVIGTFASKGTMFGGSEDNFIIVPITRFLVDMGAEKYSVNIATEAPSQTLYNATMERGITRDAGRPRAAPGAGQRLRDHLKRLAYRGVCKGRRRRELGGADHQRDRAPCGGGRDHEHHARERHGAHQGDRRPEGGRRAQDRHPHPVSRRIRRPIGDGGPGRHPAGHDCRQRAREGPVGADRLPVGLGRRGCDRLHRDRRRVRHVSRPGRPRRSTR
jgi:hypothetical protein